MEGAGQGMGERRIYYRGMLKSDSLLGDALNSCKTVQVVFLLYLWPPHRKKRFQSSASVLYRMLAANFEI